MKTHRFAELACSAVPRVICTIVCWYCREKYDRPAKLIPYGLEDVHVEPDPPGFICPKCGCGGTTEPVEVKLPNEKGT